MTTNAADLRRVVEQLYKDNLPGVLDELGTEKGTELPHPRGWVRLPDFTVLGDKQSPTVVTTTPGLVADPERLMSGGWRKRWAVRSYVVVRGRTHEETADRVGHYVDGLERALRHDALREAVGEVDDVSRLELGTVELGELSIDQARTIGAGSQGFVVTIDHAPLPVLGPS